MLVQLIILQVITFTVIVFLLRKLLYSETSKEASRLKVLQDEFSRKESELLARIDQAERDSSDKISKVREDSENYQGMKVREADEIKEAILTAAKERAEEVVKAAVNSREKMREEVELEMRSRIPVAAVRILKESLSSQARQVVHEGLVKEVIGKFDNLEKNLFKSASAGEILTAYPLKKSDKEKISAAVKTKAGHAVTLTEKEDGSIIAGLVIKIGSLVIDGSLESKLREVSERVSA